MNFLREGFRSYRPTDRQTDTTEIIHHPAWRVINNCTFSYVGVWNTTPVESAEDRSITNLNLDRHETF